MFSSNYEMEVLSELHMTLCLVLLLRVHQTDIAQFSNVQVPCRSLSMHPADLCRASEGRGGEEVFYENRRPGKYFWHSWSLQVTAGNPKGLGESKWCRYHIIDYRVCLQVLRNGQGKGNTIPFLGLPWMALCLWALIRFIFCMSSNSYHLECLFFFPKFSIRLPW